MEMLHPRIAREQNTIQKMTALYCHEKHGAPNGTLCPECRALAEYALERLHRCPFQAQKPTCAKCPIHCYKPAMREQVRSIMRYAGPRMLLHHPLLAIMHLADGLRKPPVLKKQAAKNK